MVQQDECFTRTSDAGGSLDLTPNVIQDATSSALTAKTTPFRLKLVNADVVVAQEANQACSQLPLNLPSTRERYHKHPVIECKNLVFFRVYIQHGGDKFGIVQLRCHYYKYFDSKNDTNQAPNDWRNLYKIKLVNADVVVAREANQTLPTTSESPFNKRKI
jgi:hypothetical protein